MVEFPEIRKSYYEYFYTNDSAEHIDAGDLSIFFEQISSSRINGRWNLLEHILRV